MSETKQLHGAAVRTILPRHVRKTMAPWRHAFPRKHWVYVGSGTEVDFINLGADVNDRLYLCYNLKTRQARVFLTIHRDKRLGARSARHDKSFPNLGTALAYCAVNGLLV